MLDKLLLNHYEAAAVILAGIGLTNLLLQRNIIKKIIGFNIMNSAIYLFISAQGYASGRSAPILLQNSSGEWITDPNIYVNPLPDALVLTGIVITVSITAFALALALKFYQNYGTLNIDEALKRMTDEQAELEAKILEAESEGGIM